MATAQKQDYKALVDTWHARIQAFYRDSQAWTKRGERISNIYKARSSRGGDSSSDEGARFNVFWSNVETLAPATYNRRPVVEVRRRFTDDDPVARLATVILERALQYEVDTFDDLHTTMRQVVKDRLLPGLGQCRVRYEPSFETKTLTVPDPTGQSPQGVAQEVQSISDERAPVDYIHWTDFLFSTARTWADVRWVGYRLQFSREALEKRFAKTVSAYGGEMARVPVDTAPVALDSTSSQPAGKQAASDSDDLRAEVYELWDRESRRIIWVAKGCDFPLDIKDEPLGFDEFWSCPRPLLASTTNDSILPTPDFIYYQDQIRQLDEVSARISILTDGLRLVGVHDASQPHLATLLQGGMENKLVPVNAWAAFAEKGGLKSVIDWLPLEQVANVLKGLYEARAELKQAVYEITGMADIVRGATVASETLGAQQIKAKFANLRLSARQQQVSEFVTDILRLKAHVVCTRYTEETLRRHAAVDVLPEAKAYAEAQAQFKQAQQAYEAQTQQLALQPPAPGAPPPQPLQPPQPPGPDPIAAAIALLKDKTSRQFRIEVAERSMIELDEVDERERRTEFISAVSNFFLAAKNIAGFAPEMMTVALEMLKFVVRGYAAGKSLEVSIETAIEKMRRRMEQPQQPAPPPDAIQVAKIREDGAMARLDKEIQAKERLAQFEAGAEARAREAETRHEALMTHLGQLHEAQAQTRDHMATQMQAEAQRQADFQAEGRQTLIGMMQQLLDSEAKDEVDDQQEDQEEKAMLQQLAQGQQAMQGALEQLLKVIKAPRTRIPRYDPTTGDILQVDDLLQGEDS